MAPGGLTTSETTCLQCNPPKYFPTLRHLKTHNNSCHPHAEQLICHHEDCALAGQLQPSVSCFNRHVAGYHSPILRRTCQLPECPPRGKVFDTPVDMFAHELEPVHQANPNPEPITNWICQVPGCPKFGKPFVRYRSYLKHFLPNRKGVKIHEDQATICADNRCTSFNTEFSCLRLWSEHALICPVNPDIQATIEDRKTCKDQTCKSYNKPFATVGAYHNHLSKSHPVKVLSSAEKMCTETECPLFGQSFPRISDLQHHINAAHVSAAQRTCQEQLCEHYMVEFQSVAQYQEHCSDEHAIEWTEGLEGEAVAVRDEYEYRKGPEAYLVTCQEELCRSFGREFKDESYLAVHAFQCHRFLDGLSEREKKELASDPDKLRLLRRGGPKKPRFNFPLPLEFETPVKADGEMDAEVLSAVEVASLGYDITTRSILKARNEKFCEFHGDFPIVPSTRTLCEGSGDSPCPYGIDLNPETTLYVSGRRITAAAGFGVQVALQKKKHIKLDGLCYFCNKLTHIGYSVARQSRFNARGERLCAVRSGCFELNLAGPSLGCAKHHAERTNLAKKGRDDKKFEARKRVGLGNGIRSFQQMSALIVTLPSLPADARYGKVLLEKLKSARLDDIWLVDTEYASSPSGQILLEIGMVSLGKKCISQRVLPTTPLEEVRRQLVSLCGKNPSLKVFDKFFRVPIQPNEKQPIPLKDAISLIQQNGYGRNSIVIEWSTSYCDWSLLCKSAVQSGLGEDTPPRENCISLLHAFRVLMPGFFCWALQTAYPLFFDNSLQHHSHRALVDTIKTTNMMLKYLSLVDSQGVAHRLHGAVSDVIKLATAEAIY